MITVDTISPKELDSYYQDERALIIDLRDPEEYAGNHFKNAVNIPYQEMGNYNLPRDKILILYCERGSTSLFAARELMKKGYRTKSVIGGLRSYRGPNLYFQDIHSRMY